MFLLWIACILQVIILLECENLTDILEPKYRFKFSMQQVGTILSDIDKKIKNERQLLRQLAINPTISADNTSQWLANASEHIESLARSHRSRSHLNLRHSMTGIGLDQLIDAEHVTAITSMDIGTKYSKPSDVQLVQKKEISKPPIHSQPEDVSALVDDWRQDLDVYVEQDTAQAMINKNPKHASSKKILLTSKLNNLMAEHAVGYSYAAVFGLADTILDKNIDDLKILIDEFSKTVVRMSNEGKLNSLGDLFANRVKLLRVWSSMSSVSSIQEIAEQARLAFGQKDLDDDLVQIFTRYDTLFTQEEGENLMEKIAALNEIDIKTGDYSMLSFMVENFIEAVIAPADRLHDSTVLKNLIDMINVSYLKRFPDFRRSEIDTLVNTIDEYESTKPHKKMETRRLSRSDVKFGWRKLLRHLIVKHPKLLRKFIDHFKRSRKSHRVRMHHHKNVNKNHKRTKKTPDVKAKTLEKKYDQAASPTLRGHDKRKLNKYDKRKMWPNAWFHVPQTTDIVPFRRSLGNTSTDENLSITTNAHKPRHKNKMLQKILADSSYSDEESELKTMLAEAFFNWNGTVHNNSTNTSIINTTTTSNDNNTTSISTTTMH